MHGARLLMGTFVDEDRDPREFSWIPVVIPVRVEILPAWKGAVFAAVPGALQSVLLRQGLSSEAEAAHGLRV